ncbi:MAG TPA: aminotransferase class V-fold PLP-dependent enzyme [Bacteroidales bacterium]|nr:aminotransferase class V-fold PLP-dependent enzyme [Bacteroidales bacterium]HPS73866.1 aminotransferase class V-fold PLP-dependent enzyme [Bacteroidales bacterium]
MSINRRRFLGRMGLALSAMTIPGLFDHALAGTSEEDLSLLTPEEVSHMGDSDFWGWMQQAYTVSPNIINLNNGGVSPQPKVVQDAFIRYHQLANEAPSYYMWQILDQGRTALREDMAAFAGCLPEEIAFNRNTTEGMNQVIFGLDLKAGDEVVLSKVDYPNVMTSWKTREKRDGIVLKWVSLDLPSEDEDYLVRSYVSQFTEKTKVVNLTHIINWIGQIIPVQRIADEAHKRNIEVVVDGAHTFALLDFKIPDLHCDYFATSLHKWLCAPFGAGLLYVKKDKISGLWFPEDDPHSEKITKFERLGTRSFPTEMAIGSALDFHLMIGPKRKEERLRYLKNYWMEAVQGIPKVHTHTSPDPRFGCVIGLVSIDGIKPNEFVSKLFAGYKIHTTNIDYENMSGVRVTPHVYTQPRDLDKLVKAIGEIAANS